MEQNIIELGFDMAKFTPQQKEVLDGLNQVIASAEKIESLKIGPSVSPSWKALKDSISAQALELKKLQDANVQYAKSQEALTKAETAQIVQMQQKERLAQQEIKTKKALAAESNASANATAKEAKLIDQLTNEYLQLNKAYNDAVLKYRNLFLVKGEDAAVTKQQLQTVTEYRTILDKMDKNLNIHTRNVGNYSSAFNGLGMSIQQVGRELPSLAINFQMFALAISNNLPILADELGRAKKEIAALQAEGKTAPSLFSQIGKAIFSWQSALTIGITLFTVYAKEIGDFVGSLVSAEYALKKEAEAQARRNVLMLEYLKIMRDINQINDFTNNQYNQTIRSMEAEIGSARALGKSKLDLLTLEEKLALQRELTANKAFLESGGFTELGAREKKVTSLRIALLENNRALEKDINSESLIEQKKTLEEELKNATDSYDMQFKIVDEFSRTFNQVNEKRNELATFLESEKTKNLMDSITNEANMQIAKNEVVLNSEASTEKQRLAALQSNFSERKKIIQAELDYAKKQPGAYNADGSATSETKKAILKANAETLDATIQLQDKTFQVKEDYRKRNLAADSSILKNQLAIQDEFAKNLLARETASIEDRLAAQKQLISDQEVAENDRYKMAIDKKGLTDKEVEALEKEHQTNLALIKIRGTVSTIELVRKLTLEAIQRDGNTVETANLEALTKDYNALADNLERKIITLKEFNQQKRIIDQNYTDQSLNTQLDAIDKVIEAEKKADKDITALLKQREALINNIAKNKLNKAEDDAKIQKDIDKAIWDNAKQLAFETLDAIQVMVTANYDNEIARLQELQKAKDEYYSTEIENIKNSSFSEEEKAKKIKVLEAEASAQRKKIDTEIKQENIKKVQAEREFQIFKIIGNTAIGITSALASTPPNPILAAIIGAIGAVQLAKTIATPIPKYADGTSNHPGGLAIFGEAGPEVVKEPGKDAYLVNQATLSALPKGTKVTPMDQINQVMMETMLKSQGRFMNKDSYDSSWDVARWQTNRLEKALAKNAKRSNRVNVVLKSSLDVNKSFGR